MKCDFCGSVENGELRVVQDRLDIQYLLCGEKLPAPYGLSDTYMKIAENFADSANNHSEVSLAKSTRGWLLMISYFDGDDPWNKQFLYFLVDYCPKCGKKLPSYDIKKFRAVMTKREHDMDLY